MSISSLRQKINYLTHKRLAVGILALLLNMFLLSVGGIFTPAYAAKAAPMSSWNTFHDPIYGFSIQYPPTWTLMPESDGSHITLFNPATRSSMSPIVTTQDGAPSAVLKQALSVAGAKNFTVAGHQAVSSLTPYVPVPPTKNQDAALPGGPQQIRQVIVPVTNSMNSTNVYLFRLTQPTDAKGKISTAVQADQTTFESMLNSFTLPVKVASVAHLAKAAPSLSPQVASISGCDRICWADANWSYNYYDDSSGSYSFACDANAYNYSYSTSSATCVDGNIYGAQVAGSSQYFQPNFQCADFVSRALTQDGLVPGLNNGGVNGSFPASSPFGGYSSYRATNGSSYDLLDVGVPGVAGLSNYLLDNGLATNIHQNVAQAAPGDVVFFFNGNTSTYEHTMFITSISGGNLVLDGHNMAQYHAVVSASGLDIYHLTSATSGGGGGGTGTPATTHPSSVLVKYASGAQDLIAVGSDGRMWHNWADASGNWIGWNWWSTGTDFASVTPTLVKYNDGSMDLIAVGKNGQMWHNWTSASGSWIGWNWWSNGIDFAGVSPTVIKYADGSQDLIAVTADGRMWHNWASASGSWIGWNWWSNSSFTNVAPTLINYSNGSMDLIAIGTDGRMWHNWASASGGWIGWNWWSNGTDFASVTPTLVKYNDGSMDLIAVGKNSLLWHNWTSASGSWIGWNWWGNTSNFANVTPTVIKYADGSQDVIAVTTDGRMWHNWASASGSWIGWNWFSSGTGAGFTDASPTLVQYASGAYDLIEVGMDGRMWHNWASASGSWIGWNWWSNNTAFAS